MRGVAFAAFVAGAAFLTFSSNAMAQLAFVDPSTHRGVLDQVIVEFSTRASSWKAVIMNAASWLFWTLGTISFTWTMGVLALKRADIGDFFAEFVRFILFFGFFYWVLQNGPQFAHSIIASMMKIGSDAGGQAELSPSAIVDVGFMVWKQSVQNLSIWSPVDSVVGSALSLGILIVLAVVAINMLLMLVSAWILMYAGIFFLGFGGSRWTSDMAINYFKTVLGMGAQLLAMVLLVGIGKDLLDTFYAKMHHNPPNFEELGVMLVFCLTLLLLAAKIPALLASVVTGGHGVAGAGGFTAGTVIGTAAAAATMGAAAIAGIAGGAVALKAAFEKASASVSEGVGGGMGDLMGAVSGKNDAESSLGPSPWSGGGNEGMQPASASRSGVQEGDVARGGLGKVGKIAAGTASNLGKAAWQVAKTSVGARIDRTTGGRIAAAIKGDSGPSPSSPTPQFSGDNLSSGQSSGKSEPMDVEKEVAAFVNKDIKS